MQFLLERSAPGMVSATLCGSELGDASRCQTSVRETRAGLDGVVHELPVSALPEFVRWKETGTPRPRWVWSDTHTWYPSLLRVGVRVERCLDLTLCHLILRNSVWSVGSGLAAAPPGQWDAVRFGSGAEARDDNGVALFDLEPDAPPTGQSSADEFTAQQAAVATSSDPRRLRLLLAAESAGALIAAEMNYAGLPYSATRHDELLRAQLGPRPRWGRRPAVLETLAAEIRTTLDAPRLNPDSPPELLKALQRAGLRVVSTRSWELSELDHPVIPVVLRYRKLSRLLSANGWGWLDTWVRDGRFRPDYVPGGVVSGRWATRGGGALQLPKEVRGAVVADPGWKLIVADAAQLEPRVLTGLAADAAMAAAGRGRDLYAGIVAMGAVEERSQAKVAMLGAMYGATTGDSGRLMPRLARAFPRAVRFVEEAARAGERGEIVTSRLGRSSPLPGENWQAAQSAASSPDATLAEERRARSQARDWGRFTRNFVVQASAAEWALCWMAELRNRLAALAPDGEPFTAGPHLVYFLHDEVIVHAPAKQADAVAELISACAATAGHLLFGDFPVDFPVTTAIVDSYDHAD